MTLIWISAAMVTATSGPRDGRGIRIPRLQETAQSILPLAVLDILDRDEEGIKQRIATLREHEEFFTYVVRDAQGRVLLTSHAADDGVSTLRRNRLPPNGHTPALLRRGIARDDHHRRGRAALTSGMVARETQARRCRCRGLSRSAFWGSSLVRGTFRPVRRFRALASGERAIFPLADRGRAG